MSAREATAYPTPATLTIVACPRCKAPIGAPCQWGVTHSGGTVHADRKRAADKAAAVPHLPDRSSFGPAFGRELAAVRAAVVLVDLPVVRFDASAAVRVLESVWNAIRVRHPDLPRAVVVLASGTEATKIARWGHWGAGRWRVEDGEYVGEVLIAGERLALGGAAVLETLLHEAAHALAFAGGIKDTSRQGRYHNAKYRDLALAMGLSCAKHKTHGWTVTALPDETAELYADQVAGLVELCERGHRRDVRKTASKGPQGGQGGDGEGDGDGDTEDAPKKPSRVTVACGCEVPRKLRIVVSVLELGAIRCDCCGEVFGGAS